MESIDAYTHSLIQEWLALYHAQDAATGDARYASERQIAIAANLYRELEVVAIAILNNPTARKHAGAIGILPALAEYLANGYDGQTAESWWHDHNALTVRRHELLRAIEVGDFEYAQTLTWANLDPVIETEARAYYNNFPDELADELAESQAILAGEPLPAKGAPQRLKRRRGRPRKAPK